MDGDGRMPAQTRSEAELADMIEDARRISAGKMPIDLVARNEAEAAIFERLLAGRRGVKPVGIVIATAGDGRQRVR